MKYQTHSFTNGEVSPRMLGRTDLQSYASSCSKLQNFFVQPFGGIVRRPGMEFIDKFGTTGVRLVPFRYSSSTDFMLALGDQKMRFYSNGTVVIRDGVPYEVETPWAASDTPAIRTEQILDTVFLCHPDYPPQSLFRTADNDWTLAEFTPSYPPLLDENTDLAKTITPSGTTGPITLSSNFDLFDPAHVGTYFRIGHNRKINNADFAITGTGQSSNLIVDGDYTVTTVGDWTGSVAVQASYDGGSTWEVIDSWTGANNLQVAYTGTMDYPTILRVAVTAFTSATDASISLNAASPYVYGLAKITSVTDARTAAATVVEPILATTATPYWSEGAWSNYQGFPRCVVWADGRLIFASTYGQPLALWASRVDRFADFQISGSDPSSSIVESISSSFGDTINWMVGHRTMSMYGNVNSVLTLGTGGDEWSVCNLGSSNGFAIRSSAYGSAPVGAVMVNDSIIFTQRGGELVRDLVGLGSQFKIQRDSEIPSLLTMAAEHITKGGVDWMCAVQQPIAMVFAGVKGKLIGLTYDADLKIVGWHQHPTDGVVYSGAVIPGPYGDELWLAVDRDGETCIERLHPETPSLVQSIDDTMTEREIADTISRCLFLDQGLVIEDGTSSTNVSGLPYKDGTTVSVLVDGFTHPDCTVSGGAITLQFAGKRVVVGRSYVSEMDTMPLVAQFREGETRYLLTGLSDLIADLHNSSLLEYSDSTKQDDWYLLQERKGDNDPSLPPPLQSGPTRVIVSSGHTRMLKLKIRQRYPLPATVLGLTIGLNPSQKM